MIGLPSGLERVRWKESAISPQPFMTPRIFAPRALADSRLSSTSAPAPSAMTKPSRFLAKGFAACSGGSFEVDSAESSEKRISDSGLIEPSVPMQSAALGLAAADRLDAELDRGRARRAGRRQRDRRTLGAELVGQMVGDRAEHEALVEGMELAGRGGASEIGVAHIGVGAGGGRKPGGAAAIRSRSAAPRGTAGPGNRRGCRCRTWRPPLRRRVRRAAPNSSGDDSGSAGTKSTVPAKRVFSPSVGEAGDVLDRRTCRR